MRGVRETLLLGTLRPPYAEQLWAARDLFNTTLADGVLNADRALVQFTNPSTTKPCVGDLVVYDAWTGNAFGHVAIMSDVHDDEVEVVQQNTGSPRATFAMRHINGRYHIRNERIAGWLRMP